MGRITVFTQDDCEQSILLRDYLIENEVPFHDISLTKHPGKKIKSFLSFTQQDQKATIVDVRDAFV